MGPTYVVFKGRRPGLYTDWYSCSQQVHGYRGAVFFRYESYEEAEMAFLNSVDGNAQSCNTTPFEPSQPIGRRTNLAYTATPRSQEPPPAGDADQISTLENYIMIIGLLSLVCLALSLKILFG